tara:strand:- start:548 stop:1063 length:516 start_codon:yes stop_codon:yes gene_type:complete
MPYSIFIIVALSSIYFYPVKHSKHKKNIVNANKALTKIVGIESPGKVFCYIRKIDPYIFEELVLSAIRKQGYSITRNKRYTGDNGIDGQAVINGQKVIIQAKRYKGHINNKHVSDFAIICAKLNRKGLFVHSGITGKKSRRVSNSFPNVKIISGTRLLNLLKENNCDYTWD